MNIYTDYSLKSRHTFGMDVQTALFIEYATKEELKEILQNQQLEEGRWLHIGGGSNLLFMGDYSGTILHSSIKGYEVFGSCHIIVDGSHIMFLYGTSDY